MADNTVAFFWRQLVQKIGGAGAVPGDQAGMNLPEEAPSILWGQGTPDGDRVPFTLVNKGSLYFAVDQTDDTTNVWVKQDEGSDNADWFRLSKSSFVVSTLYDISASDSEQVVFHAVEPKTIVRAFLLWEEATGASGAAEGDITIGTASGGGQIAAETPGSRSCGARRGRTAAARSAARWCCATRRRAGCSCCSCP